MDFIMENPILWGIVLVVLLIAIIVVISIFVSKNRKKEVEEIEKMFPAGNMSSEDIKISVERVRRSAKERESRKQQTKKRIHRERPKEAHPDEDKEFVRRGKNSTAKQEVSGSGKENKKEEAASVSTQAPKKDKLTRQTALKEEKEQLSKAKGSSRKSGKMLKSDLLSTSMNRHKIEKGDYKNSRGHSLLQQTIDKEKEENGEDLAVKQQKTHKAKPQSEQMGAEKQVERDQETMDKATSRRLFKRSLLKPDKETNTDSGKLPKASLIDSNMYTGQEEKEQDETETNIPSRQKRVNKKGFFSKRK